MKIGNLLLSLLFVLTTAAFANQKAEIQPTVRICDLLLGANPQGNPVIKKMLAEFIGKHSQLHPGTILDLLELPKNPDHGDYAIPVFSLAKIEKKNPTEIAAQISEKLMSVKPDWIESFNPISGFINVRLKPSFYQKLLKDSLVNEGSHYGHADWANGKTVVIDYVSPNIAKPLHIGHFRASVIGQAIRNLAETQGFNVVGLNHLGDWGIQFGDLIWAYQNWGKQYDFENNPFESLYQLYVRVKNEKKENPDLDKGGREIFRRMEAGDKEVLAIWEKFRAITLSEDQKILDTLGIKHDQVIGESFYNDQLPAMEENLRKLGLLIESDGALGVCTESGAFCLLRTQTGTSVYAARDVASAVYRHDVLHADENLYVVGNEQKDHFAMVFDILKQMGATWVKGLHHIGFGLYSNEGKKISSRDGGTLTIQELINTAMQQARIVLDKQGVPVTDRAVKRLAMAALIFNDLSGDRNNNVEFNWDRVLNLEGGGPAIIATLDRTVQILKNASAPVSEFDFSGLESAEEVDLIRQILGFQEALTASYVTYQPSILAQYLWKLSRSLNTFQQSKLLPSDSPNKAYLHAQLTLLKASRDILGAGLEILNIDSGLKNP